MYVCVVGDGLAEPIGKLYGKHKYETIALFTNQKFTRSYEGSACVFFFTAVSVVCSMSEMVSCVTCHFSTIVMISMHQFEDDKCHSSMYWYVDIY